MKKLLKVGLIFCILIIVLFFLRIPLLKALSNFLVVEDEIENVEQAFVLSGGAFDRGNKAIELYHENKIEKIICVGGNVTPNFKALGIEMLESELTQIHILSGGIDSNHISIVPNGTSTLEESNVILEYCIENSIKEIVIISSKFHSKRISNVFKEKFENEGIEVLISGAPSSIYNEEEWWKSENGLIALNNEYVKLLYYLIK